MNTFFAKPSTGARQSLWLMLPLLTVIGLAGCQPNSEADKVDSDSAATVDTADVLDSEVSPMSEAAKAHVANYEAEFVNRMLDLQQQQLAEYEALQAADSPKDSSANNQPGQPKPESDNDPDFDSDPSNTAPTNQTNAQQLDSQTAIAAEQTDSEQADSEQADSEQADSEQADSEPTDSAETNSESQLSSLQLPLINIALKPPAELTAIEISNRYNVALQSLYLDDAVPLPPQAVETLLNIANLTPNVFDNPELAERLVLKAPALARLLKQYQTWEQDVLTQKREIELLKQQQLQEQQQHAQKFEQLTEELNAKIKDYDQQIELTKKKLESLE